MSESRPNVILFVTDDHAAWATGREETNGLYTPNLDRLSQKGLRFTQAFSPSPVCSPARACLMTGLPPSRTGIHDWLQEYDDEVIARDWLAGFDTLPEMFHRAGYQTFLSGKWHLGMSPLVPRGFDHAFGMGRKIATHNGGDDYFIDGERRRLDGNRTGWIVRHACEYLQNADPRRPFFLNIGFFATHSPYHESAHDKSLIALFRDETFTDHPREASHPWGKPENGPPLDGNTEAERCKRWRGYHAAVTEIDRGVGHVLEALEATGRAENTLVLYTSDHGCCLGHHGVWGKGNGTRPVNFYEESLHVPLLVRGPGIPEGQNLDLPVTHYDTFTLMTDLCHLRPLDEFPRPGESLRALWRNPPERRCTFHEYGDADAVRREDWKLVLHHGHGPNHAFHLAEDPGETTTLPAKAAPPELAAALRDFCGRFEGERDGRKVRVLPRHNDHEPWRDGIREENLRTEPVH